MRTTPLGLCASATLLRNSPTQNTPIKGEYRIDASQWCKTWHIFRRVQRDRATCKKRVSKGTTSPRGPLGVTPAFRCRAHASERPGDAHHRPGHRLHGRLYREACREVRLSTQVEIHSRSGDRSGGRTIEVGSGKLIECSVEFLRFDTIPSRPPNKFLKYARSWSGRPNFVTSRRLPRPLPSYASRVRGMRPIFRRCRLQT